MNTFKNKKYGYLKIVFLAFSSILALDKQKEPRTQFFLLANHGPNLLLKGSKRLPLPMWRGWMRPSRS